MMPWTELAEIDKSNYFVYADDIFILLSCAIDGFETNTSKKVIYGWSLILSTPSRHH